VHNVGEDIDYLHMARAIELGLSVRTSTSPNPWVGCVLVPEGGALTFEGATEPIGGDHAEAVALRVAREHARGSTVYVTLEPCSHVGKTPACADALIEAGVHRVVIGAVDPDARVRGNGINRLRAAGIVVDVGVNANEIADVLAPYLKHRLTGRPWVVLKLAATLDGRIGAPDGTSRWITGTEARVDAHRLRAESDAVLVGAGTVRSDDPELTVRFVKGRDPLRVVLGSVTPDARVQPAMEMSGDIEEVLDTLGEMDVLQLLVEGGSHVAHAFHHQRLVDRYVLYLAPAIFGGDDSVPMFSGEGARDMDALWRGKIVGVTRLGADLRVDLESVEGAGTR